jgi:dTDP-glucose pyrophosphorylase/CBS domain-containing protein
MQLIEDANAAEKLRSKAMSKIESYFVTPETTLREVIACIDRNSKGIALVVDSERLLLGTISDGDIRRAILRDVNLDLPVQSLLEECRKTAEYAPVTAPLGSPDVDLLRLMNKRQVRQIPIVDTDGRIKDIAFLGDLASEYELPLTAVVMAGGFGMRLRPLTDNTPKPMLHIGDRPILERTIEQLKKTGIHRISLTTHYKPQAISDHFGNGEGFGVDINYVQEDQPLGTAGALALLEDNGEPLLVINGDILTHVDFRAMLRHHREHKACLTVGVCRYDLQIPYGVIQCHGTDVLGVSEKPKIQHLVNAGIYLLEPEVRQYIPAGKKFDMTDLIQSLINAHRKIVSFPIVEYWLDVGRPGDYERAQEDVRTGRIS